MVKKLIFAVIVLNIALTCELHARIYKWTDEEGVIHISDSPRPEKIIQSPSPPKKTEQKSPGKTPANIVGSRYNISGTKITLIPPPEFKKAERFPGFYFLEYDSSIMVTGMPAPYDKMEKAFSRSNLSSKGMSLIERSNVTICGNKSLLLNISQFKGDRLYEKWVVVTGDKDETYLVTAAFPREFHNKLSNVLRSSVLSIECTSDTIMEFSEGLTFTISDSPKMKLAKQMGNNIILTKDGTFRPKKNNKDPFLMAGSSASEGLVIENKESYAVKRVQQTATLKNIEIESLKSIRIDDLPGYEITAIATDEENGWPIYVYQVLLFGETDYYIIVGLVASEDKAEYLPTFKEIAKTFKRK